MLTKKIRIYAAFFLIAMGFLLMALLIGPIKNEKNADLKKPGSELNE